MTARLVAVGHVKPEHGTITIRVADGDPIWEPRESAELPDLPDWLWNGGREVDDPDLWDKQRKEEDIAWGTGL